MAEIRTNAAPAGMAGVTPHLVCAGAADAIAFYRRAFGAEEVVRRPGPGGKLVHAAVRINGSVVLLVDEFPDYGMTSPTTLGDVDAAVARAVEAGATVTMPVADQFWGDRYGVIRDPFGHSWSIATHLRDMTPEEIEAAMKAMPA